MENGLKLKQVLEGRQALETLISSDRKNKIVVASSVRIKLASNVRKTRDPVEIYNEERSSKIQELGEEIKDKPGAFRVKPENAKAFSEFEKDALNSDTDVKFLTVTEIELFGDPDLGADRQNQIDLDVLAVFKDVGILV